MAIFAKFFNIVFYKLVIVFWDWRFELSLLLVCTEQLTLWNSPHCLFQKFCCYATFAKSVLHFTSWDPNLFLFTSGIPLISLGVTVCDTFRLKEYSLSLTPWFWYLPWLSFHVVIYVYLCWLHIVHILGFPYSFFTLPFYHFYS